MKILINQAGLDHLADRLLHQVLVPAMEIGMETAKAYAPVDTSSLQTDIRVQNAKVENGNPTAELAAGGGDYRGMIMKTGKEGKLVDYALQQEIKHGFLESGIMAAVAEISR
jgi:hypothetical protein